jgi:type I restriction enzyme M protein
MLAPYKGRVYDPCCGSGGMFVQSEKFIHAHANGNGNGGKAKPDISIWGQESNYTTWRLAKMNLAIRGIDAQIAHGDTFHNDRHPDLKADYVLANPARCRGAMAACRHRTNAANQNDQAHRRHNRKGVSYNS